LVGSYCCSSCGVANPFISFSFFSNSSIRVTGWLRVLVRL
jgi:hypothetical protein